MASSTADTGLPKVAAMPAAAPAASSVLRSIAVVSIICPISEPNAPPVAMIGPSAPKGPPVPMAMAALSGLRKVRRRDAALVQQHLLHRLGDAVPPDGLGAVAGHEADEDSADNRDGDHPQPQPVVGRRPVAGGEPAEEADIGDQPDKPNEHLRDDRRGDGQADRQERYQHDAGIDQRRFGRHIGLRQRRPHGDGHGKVIGRRSTLDLVFQQVACRLGLVRHLRHSVCLRPR